MKVSERAMLLALVLVAVLSCGCITVQKRPGLLIGNATESNFSEVVVQSGDDVYLFTDVEAFKVSKPSPRRGELEDSIHVRWNSQKDGESAKSVVLPDTIRSYSGHIQLELGEAGKVKVFTAPVQDNGDSVLPWSMPANWEGSPSVPGMNM